jgi:cytochrome P450
MTGRLPGPRSRVEALKLGQRLNRDLPGTLETMHQQYGPVVEVGWVRFRFIYLFGVEANEYVLSKHAANFTWHDAFQPLVAVNGETALVVSDGADHKRRRAIVQPAFHMRRIASYLDVMVNETERMLDSWAPGSIVNAYADFRLAIRRIVLRCLFGDVLTERDAELAEQLEVALAYVNRSPLRRFDVDLPGTPFRACKRARQAVDDIVFREITRRRSVGTANDDDVLGWLLDAQDNEGPGLSDQEVRDQVVSLVAAGYDTTASAMGWIAAQLAETPALAAAVRSEVDRVTGGERLTIEHLPKLVTAAAVVAETLRLHPPAAFSGRRVVDSFELHGHTIPAESMILFSPHVSHRLVDQFPSPTEFKPGRWIEGHADHSQHHNYAYIPYGGGSRRCLGFAFANQELTVMTALLAQRLIIERAYTDPLKPTGIMSMAPAGGVPVRVCSD